MGVDYRYNFFGEYLHFWVINLAVRFVNELSILKYLKNSYLQSY